MSGRAGLDGLRRARPAYGCRDPSESGESRAGSRRTSPDELDAFYARAYGLDRDELRYILDPADVKGADYPSETFRVLEERETRQPGSVSGCGGRGSGPIPVLTPARIPPAMDQDRVQDRGGWVALTPALIRATYFGMATMTIKTTYSLDVETAQILDAMARRWKVSKSEALRRAIRSAGQVEPSAGAGALAALDALQRSLDLSTKDAAAWARRARAERRASAVRREAGLK